MTAIQLTNTTYCRDGLMSDVERIAHLHTHYWREIYGTFLPECVFEDGCYDFRLVQWRNWFEESSPQKILQVIADRSDTVIGFMSANPNDESYVEEAECLLGFICIPPELRGRIGQKLMLIWYEAILAASYSSMVGWTFEQNYEQHKRLLKGGNFVAVCERIFTIGGYDIPSTGYLCRDVQKEVDRLNRFCGLNSIR